MVWELPSEHPLRRLFAGYAEHTFQQNFGVADPKLIDYLSGLLSRFVHTDAIHRLKSSTGRPLDQVADMVAEVADLPVGRSTREIHRHIGDYSLFWTGVYPDALRQLRHTNRIDYFVDYCRQGKRSYWLASQYDDEPFHDEATVLRRISDDFEMCAYGLLKVREEWEKDRADSTGRLIGMA